jgi:hypothetical protein
MSDRSEGAYLVICVALSFLTHSTLWYKEGFAYRSFASLGNRKQITLVLGRITPLCTIVVKSPLNIGVSASVIPN